MPGSANECEAYARDCVRLAEHPNLPPEVRDRLLEMARMWMEVAMNEKKRGADFMPLVPSDARPRLDARPGDRGRRFPRSSSTQVPG
jgi:hypothetical protein